MPAIPAAIAAGAAVASAIANRKKNNASDTQTSIAQSQINASNLANQWATQDRAQRDEFQAPWISFLKSLAGGDRNAALEASMPVISRLSGGFGAAKQNILNSIPAGAARDKALADLELNRATTTAGTQAQMIYEAPQQLSQVGTERGQSSLQEFGAMLAALQGGAQTTQSQGNMEAQKNSSTLNFFSNLAQQAGNAYSAWQNSRSDSMPMSRLNNLPKLPSPAISMVPGMKSITGPTTNYGWSTTG